MKIRQIIARVAATMKNADCVFTGQADIPARRYFMFFFRDSSVRRVASELSLLPAYYSLAKIPPVGHSKRENTIDGSAIFRAIEQEASRRCCKGKKEGVGWENKGEQGMKREKESAGVEERRDMLSHDTVTGDTVQG